MADREDLNPLTVLNGRYVIVRRLHQGELGGVYLAKDRLLACDVAIKELEVDPTQRETTIARFEHHASQWTALQHPSIPRIHGSFYVEEFDCFYVVMDYVEGTDLASMMLNAPNGRLHEMLVTELAIQVSYALHYLHTRPTPIIYQNLKPARVMVTSELRAMLMPWFGRWTKEEKAETAVGGTPGYAPPELFSGKVYPESDVYSLGATMFQLLTGVDPQDDPLLIFDFTKNPRPGHINPTLSPEMDEILVCTVEYRPEDRFSAERLLRILLDLRYFLFSDNTIYKSSEEFDVPAAITVWCSYCGTQMPFSDKVCALGHVNRSRGWNRMATNESPEPPAEKPPLYLDENVQFTVFRPSKIKPLKWYPLLAYAHLTEPRDDEDVVDPIARVQQDAERIMRDQSVNDYRQTSEDSRVAIPRKGEISFVPFIRGVEFNPSRASFYWEESVHRQEFRMRAPWSFKGKIARGTMSVFLGAILLAEINLTIKVSSEGEEVQPEREKPARPYRRIFPSYSHKDREIVSQLEHYAQITGDKYMRDVFELRSGQNWKQWMAETIEAADIFQLFWSTNSMRSANVRLEWEYALRLQREHFIRPTYWEIPLPASQSENLPPHELRDLHFQHVRPPAYVDEMAKREIESRNILREQQSLRRRRRAKDEGPLAESESDSVEPPPPPIPGGYQPMQSADEDKSFGCAPTAVSLLWPIVTIVAFLGLLLILLIGFFFWLI